MPLPRLLLVLLLAAGFGALNAVLVHLHARPLAEFGSHVLNAGWAWAGLAVAAGALTRTRALGALAGATAALVGLATYYLVDAALRDVSVATSARGDLIWGAASVLVCPVLGVLGSRIGRPGVVALLAALLVPVGALAEMLLLPPGPPSPAVTWTRWTVGLLALAAIAAVLRFRPRSAPATSGRSPHRPPPPPRR